MDDPIPLNLPGELRAFLYSCIDVMEEVDILVAVSRSRQSWSVNDVSLEFGYAEGAARTHLETLVNRGLLALEPGHERLYRYRPQSAELARFGDLLSAYYETSRTAILGFVLARTQRAAKEFGSAFSLRKPPTRP